MHGSRQEGGDDHSSALTDRDPGHFVRPDPPSRPEEDEGAGRLRVRADRPRGVSSRPPREPTLPGALRESGHRAHADARGGAPRLGRRNQPGRQGPLRRLQGRGPRRRDRRLEGQGVRGRRAAAPFRGGGATHAPCSPAPVRSPLVLSLAVSRDPLLGASRQSRDGQNLVVVRVDTETLLYLAGFPGARTRS